ncbi:MAG: 2-oxo acid dehydrogenase subunit E2 [Thermoplasmata archaeon]|nr:2-oxo acid dehydrogenase subunit E2 [Thermoplasmata archaeon]
MVTEFRFPDVGEGITEGTVKKWLVKEGDVVDEDQVLAEVETDKAVVEMPAPVGGTVLKIHVQEDEVINVGQVLVVIGEAGEAVPEPSAAPTPAPTPTAVAPAGSASASAAPAPTAVTAAPSASTGAAGGKVRATPKVRRLAKQRGVDLSTVTPTGSGGRITEADVNAALEALRAAAAVAAPKPAMKVKLNYDFYGHIKHRSFKGLRKVIADNMVESMYTAPHATAMEEVDTSALWDLRKEMKAEGDEQGVKLTFLPYIIMATVKALQKHPSLNSELDEEEADIIVKEYANIGVAVDTDEGLMVPVLKRTEHKDIWQIAKEVEELTKRARSRKIDLADLKGGSFTISNYGSVGGMYGVPIINFPEAAILGVGRMRDVPRVVDGEIVVRKVMGLSVSFDHRIVDGAEVAGFINTLKYLFENPEEILVKEEPSED